MRCPWFILCKLETQEANGVAAWGKSRDLRTQKANNISPSLSPEAWEPRELMMQFPVQDKRRPLFQFRVRANSPFFQFFILLRPSANWKMPIHVEECNLFYSVYQLNCQSHPETSSQTQLEMFTQILGNFWLIKLTITLAM